MSYGKDVGPGLLEWFRETSAYDRLSQEAGALGDRVIEELSSTAQLVVLPALLKKIKNWIGLDLSARTPSMATNPKAVSSYEPATSRAGEL
jgi:DNA mismatch repair protein MutH